MVTGETRAGDTGRAGVTGEIKRADTGGAGGKEEAAAAVWRRVTGGARMVNAAEMIERAHNLESLESVVKANVLIMLCV